MNDEVKVRYGGAPIEPGSREERIALESARRRDQLIDMGNRLQLEISIRVLAEEYLRQANQEEYKRYKKQARMMRK